MPDIVGYSTNDTFDTNNLPDGLKAFLQLYDETLAAVENNDARVVSDIKKAKANQKKHTVVAPLLGDINWGWATYNGYYDISILNPSNSDYTQNDYTHEVLMMMGQRRMVATGK